MTFEHEGTVSHGTMKTEDLIPTFESFIDNNYPDLTISYAATPRNWSDDDYLHYLFDLLDDLAPTGYYFGAHEGDGSDYGFWKIDEEYGGYEE